MKNSNLFVLAMILLLVSTIACSYQGKSSAEMIAVGNKLYPIESAIIEYTYKGTDRLGEFEGDITVYFDRWGLREATYSRIQTTRTVTTTILDYSSSSVERTASNILLLKDGQLAYKVNLDSRIAQRGKVEFAKEAKDFLQAVDLVEFHEIAREKKGMRKVGSEKVAGKICDVWKTEVLETPAGNFHSKEWVWETIVLKDSTTTPRESWTKIATRVEDGVSIPIDKLTLPSDVTFKK